MPTEAWSLQLARTCDVRHPLTSRSRLREVLFHDSADYFEVDLEIFVQEHVAKAGNGAPRYFRLRCPEAITQPLGRFRDGLQIAYHRVLHQVRIVEC